MPLSLYNTKTRTKELFESINDKEVSMYSCGPTVYSSAHIGNMRSFVMADLLKRTLIFLGYNVKHVMNITDVGHLIRDTELDKMEEAAKRENKTAFELSELYTREFMNDIKKLNVIPADSYPKATEHINEQIELIKQLEAKGFTYKISDGIYFDTSKFENYGKFSGQSLEEKSEGARVQANPEKKNPSDFALWKFSPTREKRLMEWNSPWGIGFPGWHIECSAMSVKYLGQPFDIHTGGIDLIPVHHENEIAQSSAACEIELARFWIHGEFVLINDDKMAKSEGNVITVSSLEEQGFEPLSYRYLMLGTHYRTKLNFSEVSLLSAQNGLFKIRNELRDWKTPTNPDIEFINEFRDVLNDDMNIPQALAVMHSLIKSDLDSEVKSATILEFDRVFGLRLNEYIGVKIEIPEAVHELAEKRFDARLNKNFEEADVLRKQIELAGFEIMDKSDGYEIGRKLNK